MSGWFGLGRSAPPPPSPRDPSPPVDKHIPAPNLIPCFRSPQKGIDLVAFTESTSYIHIVDVWSPDQHQTIRVAPDNEETDICGLCFSPDNRFLYVALHDRLVQLTVDLAARRCRPQGTLM